MPDPSPWLDSRLADTAPALVGAALLLVVVFAFVVAVLHRLGRVADRQAGAVEKLAGAVEKQKDRDDARDERHFDVLRQLGVQCNTHHQSQDVKLDQLLAAQQRIETHLGKARGA